MGMETGIKLESMNLKSTYCSQEAQGGGGTESRTLGCQTECRMLLSRQ